MLIGLREAPEGKPIEREAKGKILDIELESIELVCWPTPLFADSRERGVEYLLIGESEVISELVPAQAHAVQGPEGSVCRPRKVGHDREGDCGHGGVEYLLAAKEEVVVGSRCVEPRRTAPSVPDSRQQGVEYLFNEQMKKMEV